MAERKPYWELLRDPRWQKKRLEIMERDDFTCHNCGDYESTLNVHHGYYAKGKMPWDYPSESLRTLCETCHKNAEELRLTILMQLAKMSDEDIQEVLGFIAGRRVAEGNAETFRAETVFVLSGAFRAVQSSYDSTFSLALKHFDKTHVFSREELIDAAMSTEKSVG